MLDTFRTFLSDLVGGTKPQDRFGETDYRLAAAALLVHVITVDGAVTQAERDKLHAVLGQHFGLDAAATDDLVAHATVAEGEAVDLYHFTSLLNRALDEEGRRRVVAMMWEMVYADGRVNEFEDNILWRVADLLGVPSRERIALREQAASARSEAEKAG